MVVMALVSLLFSLVSLVCSILILIHAFQQSVGKGFLCLCVPCYIIYYMFSEFEHPQKGLIIAGFWVGALGSGIINGVTQMNARQAMMSPGVE